MVKELDTKGYACEVCETEYFNREDAISCESTPYPEIVSKGVVFSKGLVRFVSIKPLEDSPTRRTHGRKYSLAIFDPSPSQFVFNRITGEIDIDGRMLHSIEGHFPSGILSLTYRPAMRMGENDLGEELKSNSSFRRFYEKVIDN